MSRHSSTYLAPSSLPNTSSPTTSTELLISAPHQTPMNEPKSGESSKGSRSTSSRSGSTVQRTRRSSHPQPTINSNDAIDIARPPTIYTPPQSPPSVSAIQHPSRMSEDLAPSISPSALEAGYAKEPDSTRVSRTATGDEKVDERHVTKVWPPWKRDDGWNGWRTEWVKKEALVVPLVVQAFSAGVLDATTYADFMTFASNRMSPSPRF